MLRILLDSGDDPSPGLKEAILHHRTDIVPLLLNSGAKQNVNSENGAALVQACKSGHSDIMKLLLDAGADPLNCKGESMEWACRQGE